MERLRQLEGAVAETVWREPDTIAHSASTGQASSLLDSLLDGVDVTEAFRALTASEQATILQYEQSTLSESGILDGLTLAEPTGKPTENLDLIAAFDALIDLDPKFKRIVEIVRCPLCGQSPCRSASGKTSWPFGKVITKVEVDA